MLDGNIKNGIVGAMNAVDIFKNEGVDEALEYLVEYRKRFPIDDNVYQVILEQLGRLAEEIGE